MRTLETDVLIVGSGGAALRAAIAARETSPPMLCATMAMRSTGTGQVSAKPCSNAENARPLAAIDTPLL